MLCVLWICSCTYFISCMVILHLTAITLLYIFHTDHKGSLSLYFFSVMEATLKCRKYHWLSARTWAGRRAAPFTRRTSATSSASFCMGRCIVEGMLICKCSFTGYRGFFFIYIFYTCDQEVIDEGCAKDWTAGLDCCDSVVSVYCKLGHDVCATKRGASCVKMSSKNMRVIKYLYIAQI